MFDHVTDQKNGSENQMQKEAMVFTLTVAQERFHDDIMTSLTDL